MTSNRWPYGSSKQQYRRDVRWRHGEGGGLEHLALRGDERQIVAEGFVIGTEDDAPYALSYRVVCDSRWRTREVTVSLAGGERQVRLAADGEGRWCDGADRPLPALDGCIDVDIAVTPFTNTLPIRRLDLEDGEHRDLRAVYLPVPTLAAAAVDQRYTCLERGRRYRYEGYPPGFMADLTVDADGLVVDYPGLFARVLS